MHVERTILKRNAHWYKNDIVIVVINWHFVADLLDGHLTMAPEKSNTKKRKKKKEKKKRHKLSSPSFSLLEREKEYAHKQKKEKNMN
jgi:hypothetical protein